MPPLEQLAGVPATFRLSDGNEYTFSPLTLRDLAEVRGWERQQRVKAFLDACPKAQVALASPTIARILSEPVSDQEAMGNIAGSLFLLWRSISRKHPAITYEAVADLVGGDLGSIMRAVDAISGFGGDAKSPLDRAPSLTTAAP